VDVLAGEDGLMNCVANWTFTVFLYSVKNLNTLSNCVIKVKINVYQERSY